MNKVKAGKYEYLRCKLFVREPKKQLCTSHTSHSIRLNELENKIDNIKDTIHNMKSWKQIVNKYKDFKKLTNLMISELIDYIEIGEETSSNQNQQNLTKFEKSSCYNVFKYIILGGWVMNSKVRVWVITIMVLFSNLSFCFASNDEESFIGTPIAQPYISNEINEIVKFKNITGVKIVDEIELRVYFDGNIKLYNLFNPPDGDIIKIIGTPTPKTNEEKVILIRCPIEKLEKAKEITIRLVDKVTEEEKIICFKTDLIKYDELLEAVEFKDSNLEKVVRDVISKQEGYILKEDLENVLVLDASNKKITDLEGVQYIKNLKSLNLQNNLIQYIQQLSYLNQLEVLYLKNNTIYSYEPLASIYKNLKSYDFPNEFIKLGINNGEYKEMNMIKENEEGLINYTVSVFSDIEKDNWFTKNVAYLVGMRAVDGYSDGTFKPNGEVSIDTFLKITVTTLGYELENGKEYWATPFINKARELNLVREGEFGNYRRQITRGEMARILARAMEKKGESSLDIENYSLMIKDYESIPQELKEYVTTTYLNGIITGYPDGEFKAGHTATRAEAATMIIRLLDVNSRVKPTKRPLELLRTWPNNGQEGVILKSNLISLVFSDDMNGECDLSKISIISEFGDRIPIKKTFIATKHKDEFYIDLNSKLKENTKYTLTIPENTLESANKAKYDKKINLIFTTGSLN